MSFGKKDPPPPPDYTAAARTQGGANLQSSIAQALLSQPNQITPYGTQTYNQIGEFTIPGAEGNPAVNIPRFQSEVNLTPEGQARFDQEQRIMSRLGNVAESGLGRVGESFDKPFSFGSAEDARNRAEEALLSRLEPQFDRDEDMMRQRLANQGIRSGSEAFGRDVEQFNQSKNDARLQAILRAGPEQDRALQTESFLRSQPLNELNALRTGSQVNMPTFSQSPQIGVAPAPTFAGTQAAGQNAADIYNAQQAASGNFQQGLFGLGGTLGGAAILASDRSVKRNIRHLGNLDSGIPVYEFTYVGSNKRHVGVMADEVRPVIPEAVVEHEGVMYVDYSRLH